MPETPKEAEHRQAAEIFARGYGVPTPLNADQLHWLGELFPYLSAVPITMHGGIVRYVLTGQRPGEFLCALLSNNLMETVARADWMNLGKLHEWMILLHNGVPGPCFGSEDAVIAWNAQGGLAAPAAAPAVLGAVAAR